MMQVAAVSGMRAATPAGRSALVATQRRWQILRQQLAEGRDPCFQSDRRYSCPERACAWRSECVVMRAEWKR